MVNHMTKTELENCIFAYGKDIYSFCKSITLHTQEADDLYQDTFLKAMELLSEIDGKQNPKSYLLSIALRLWKNKKRKHAWRKQIASMVSITEESDLDLISRGFYPGNQFSPKRRIRSCPQGRGKSAGKIKNNRASLLYGRFAGNTDFPYFKNSCGHGKKQTASRKKSIKKRIGGCFR